MSKLNLQTIVRQLDPNVCIFSAPFFRYGLVPVGGRSTAVKLNSGDLWVLASTPLNEVTKTKLDELGTVKYLIAPDAVHHVFLKEYKSAYPQAKLIGVKEHLAKYNEKDLKFDGAYGHDPAGTKYGYEEEILVEHFTGHQNKDLAFYHIASKSLIEADLLFNFPAKEQHSKAGGFNLLTGLSAGPDSGIHKNLVKGVTTDKAAMKKSATVVANWDIQRIIPCHGDVIEKDANKAWRSAFSNFLD